MAVPQQNSIITQVSEAGEPSNILSNEYDYDNVIKLNLRGVLFEITRHELLRLPESILLGISNGMVVEENAGVSNISEVEVANVNFSPGFFQYALDVFRKVADEVPPLDTKNELAETPGVEVDEFNFTQSSLELKKSRRAIIVLREDLDYYCIPLDRAVSEQEMNQVKRECGEILSEENKVFEGLRKGNEPGTAEQHLVDMLCSSGFSIDDDWGFRSSEGDKAVISSLSLTRLLTQEPDENMDEAALAEAMLPHKLLLFWRKPARKCWWDTTVLKDVGEVGAVRVHIRRVWTLELSVIR